jgi:hypothetical protein
MRFRGAQLNLLSDGLIASLPATHLVSLTPTAKTPIANQSDSL